MNWRENIKNVFRHPVFNRYTTVGVVWGMATLAAWLLKHPNNNFIIFRNVFWHVLHQMPLYAEYPEIYHDINHYGPSFSFIVAPFALFPVKFGYLLWLAAMSALLFIAIRTLPFERKKLLFIMWFCANELYTALCLAQFNIVIGAMLILIFVCIEKEKEVWAALLIVIGLFVKIYGIVGLAFFFFSHRKTKLILSLIGWSLVFFALPMLYSSPEYILRQYGEWLPDLIAKNAANHFSLFQNISLLGIVRKISGNPDYSDMWLIIPGLILFALPYLRTGQYASPTFRRMFLVSVMLFVVLFSTGSESSSYIIALTGVAVWFRGVPWKRPKGDIALLIFAFVLTSMSPSDLFPAFLYRPYVQPYALKALPCVLIWFKLIYEMMTRNYAAADNRTPELIPSSHKE